MSNANVKTTEEIIATLKTQLGTAYNESWYEGLHKTATSKNITIADWNAAVYKLAVNISSSEALKTAIEELSAIIDKLEIAETRLDAKIDTSVKTLTDLISKNSVDDRKYTDAELAKEADARSKAYDTLSERIDDTEARLDVVQGDADTEGSIAHAKAAVMSEINSHGIVLESHNERLTTAEEDIDDLETDIAALETDVEDLADDVSKLPKVDAIKLELSQDKYLLSASLFSGTAKIHTSTVDLPLEESVIDISFDENDNDIVLKLRNGNTSRVPLDSLFRGVVTSLTDTSTDKALSAATGQLITDITTDLQRQISDLSDADEGLSANMPDSIDVELTDEYMLKVAVKKGDAVLYSDTEDLLLKDMVTDVSYNLQDDGKSVDLHITLRDTTSYDIHLVDVITAAKLNEILTNYSTASIKEYYLTQTEGFVKLVEKSQNGSPDTITSEVAVIVPDGVTLRNNAATGRTEIYGVRTISGSVLKFYTGTKADFYDKYTADERRNTMAFFTDDDTKEKFDKLMSWYEETHPSGLRLIDFRSSLDNLVYERGDSVSQAIGFTYTFNKTPKTLTLNGDGQDISGNTGYVTIPTATYTTDTSWVLRATGDDGEVAEGTVKLDFKSAVFYGVSTSPVCDSSIITSFTKVLSDEHLRSFNVESGTDKFIYYCVPVSFDTVTPGKFQISGFGLPGGIQKQDYTVSYTYGTSTTNYAVYCTDYAGFGDRTVTIKSKEE